MVRSGDEVANYARHYPEPVGRKSIRSLEAPVDFVRDRKCSLV